MVAGVYALLQHRERARRRARSCSAPAIKLTAGLFLPFALAARGAPHGRAAGRRDVLIGAGVAGAALVAVSGSRCSAAGRCTCSATLQQSQSEGDWHSIPGFISTRLGLGDGRPRRPGSCSAIVFVGRLLLARCAASGAGELDWIDGAGWATVALLVTASSLLPWYVAWLMPLAALGDRPAPVAHRDRR